MRAHPDLSFCMCVKSVFIPWHNEFLAIQIYLAAIIYTLVMIYLLIIHDESTYGFKDHEAYSYMFVLTFSILVAFTMTLIYHIFYSMSDSYEKSLSMTD